jgi:hypothetical protein
MEHILYGTHLRCDEKRHGQSYRKEFFARLGSTGHVPTPALFTIVSACFSTLAADSPSLDTWYVATT